MHHDQLKTIEEWAAEKGTPAWLLAAAKAGELWPGGKELAETEYDEALTRAANTECR